MSLDYRFLTERPGCPTITQTMTLTVRSAILGPHRQSTILTVIWVSLTTGCIPLHTFLAPESLWSIQRILQELMAEGVEEVSPGVSSNTVFTHFFAH